MNRRNSPRGYIALIAAIIVVAAFVALIMDFRYALTGYARHGGPVIGDYSHINNTETSPQWSSDGSVIVTNLFGAIYGVNVDGSKLWRITAAGESDRWGIHYLLSLVDSHDRVSYDKYLYDDRSVGWFIDNTPHKVSRETIGIDGSDIERVTESSFEYAPQLVAWEDWSPDGSRIAYNDRIDIGVPDIIYTVQDGPSSYSSYSWGLQNILAVMSSDGSSAIQFPKSLFSGKSIRPVWSRDGRRIAYVRYELRGPNISPVREIVTANWDGTDAKTALEVKSSLQSILPSSLEWSISNDFIYFIKNEWRDEPREERVSSSLRSVRLDGSDERVIIRKLDDGLGAVKASPDGKRLLVEAFNQTAHRLYTVSTDGVDIRKIYESEDRYGIGASWSPDGSRIAVQDHSENGLLVFTISPDGSDARVVIGPGVQPGYGKPLPEAAGR